MTSEPKELELKLRIAPEDVAVLRNQASQTGLSQFAAIQSAALPLGIEVRPVGVHDAGEIERGIAAVSQSSNAGLIATTGAFAVAHRQLLIALAARDA